ncbi:MAG TPA: DNA polymerase I [Pyrinomonadaceae bacterium]|nr:DNA polymerase I [Pyrinomonadaceae bacterium]
MKRVFLIDSMSHIYRAFFAPMNARAEPLRNSKGQVTQAVFVFTNMLRKLLKDEKPDYIAAIFESEEGTFRHDSYAEYKANRQEMPSDLADQIPYILRVCEAFSIPVLQSPKYEADDVIGTLAKKVADKNMQAVIVSNDKDLCQLVKDPNIIAMRQNSQNVKRKVAVPPIEWCDEAWVQNKFGVPADKIIDLLGLMGDSIDNIPGAPGIGEKGALKLVLEFGSAEGAMENADKVTHKTYRESLQNNQPIIRQSLELATIHCDAPIDLDLDLIKAREPDRKLAYQLFRELEFNSLIREFEDSATLFEPTNGDKPAAAEQKYSIINNRADLDNLIRLLWEKEQWSFEIDDSNGDERQSCFHKVAPAGIAIAFAAGESYYIDLDNFKEGKESAIGPLRDILSNGFLEKSAYDHKRQFGTLETIGIEPTALKEDPLIAAYLLDSTRSNYSPEFLAHAFLEIEPARDIPENWAETAFRTAERADWVFQLAPILRSKIVEADLVRVYDEIELPIERVLADIEWAGMKVDGENLKEFSEFMSKELERLKKEIYELAGREFNIGSPKQVGEVFEELNISTGRKTATGQISTSRDVLDELAHTYPIAKAIIDYREIDKLKSTYADSLPKMISPDGRIHGCLTQTVAATGRLSSTDPNLQNIPVRTELGQRIRQAFVPEKGNKLLSADYSQLELRILAHITRDPVMLEAYQTGEDIHAKTARLVFGAKDEKELKEKRRLAKIVNFGIAYAVEAFGLSTRVGISRAEARQVIDDYFETYKGIRKYMDETPEVARKQGYIASLFGRRRYFPSINDRNYTVRSRAEREAINMPIQGTASDIVKIAMLRVHEALKKEGLKTQMIMQVHDELLFEAPESEVKKASEIIKREMEAAASLDVPLEVEVGVGDNWMDAK